MTKIVQGVSHLISGLLSCCLNVCVYIILYQEGKIGLYRIYIPSGCGGGENQKRNRKENPDNSDTFLGRELFFPKNCPNMYFIGIFSPKIVGIILDLSEFSLDANVFGFSPLVALLPRDTQEKPLIKRNGDAHREITPVNYIEPWQHPKMCE